MQIKNMRLFKGFCAFIITLALLLVGQLTWRNFAVNMPLEESLQSIAGVQKIVWLEDSNINSPAEIQVYLDSAADLQKTYKSINEKIIQSLKSKPYKLIIRDSRTPELEKFYYDIHFYIQKAIADGDFPLLAEKTEEKAQKLGIKAKVFVDEQYVYVQINKNDNSLYSLVSRSSNKTGGSR